MKKNILILVFTFFIVILFALLYPNLAAVVEKTSSNKSKTEIISANDKVVIKENMIQNYEKEIYFWKHQSEKDFKTAALDNSNNGIKTTDSHAEVDTRIEAFMAKKETIVKDQILVEIANSSGSCADCNISIIYAKVQVARIAKARKISYERIDSLIMEHTSKRLIGVLGPQKINVIFLNTELDKLKK